MAGDDTELETLRKGGEEAAKRARALFTLLLGVSAYSVLAVYDRSSGDLLLEEQVQQARLKVAETHVDATFWKMRLDDAHRQCAAAKQKREELADPHHRVEITPSAASPADLDTVKCQVDVGVATAGPAELEVSIRELRDLLQERRAAELEFKTAEDDSRQMDARLGLANKHLALARTAWERNDDSFAQARLKQEFLEQRGQTRALQAKHADAAAKLANAKRRFEHAKAHADPFLAEYDAQRQLDRALVRLRAVQQKEKDARELRNHWKKALTDRQGKIKSAQSASMKLPVVDVELSRQLFHLASPMLIVAIMVHFGFSLLQVKRRLDAYDTHPSAPHRPRDRALSLPPSALLAERYASLAERAVVGLVLFATVPALLWVLSLASSSGSVPFVFAFMGSVIAVVLAVLFYRKPATSDGASR